MDDSAVWEHNGAFRAIAVAVDVGVFVSAREHGITLTIPRTNRARIR